MKTLLFLAVLFLWSCEKEGVVSNPEEAASLSEDLKQKFQDICATHRDSGFEERLAEIIPVGAAATEIQDLLRIADRKKIELGTRIYVFDNATGAFSEQGLVVWLSVENQSGRIKDVRSAIAAN